MLNIKKCSCGFEVTEEMKYAYKNEWCPSCGKGVRLIKIPVYVQNNAIDCNNCAKKYTCVGYSQNGKNCCNSFVEEY